MMNERPASTALILTAVAAYLDIDDRKHGLNLQSDSEVQEDLQSIAIWLNEHPEIDQQIHAFVSRPKATV